MFRRRVATAVAVAAVPVPAAPTSVSVIENLIAQLDLQVLDSYAYISILQRCGHARAVSHGKFVHEHIVKNGLIKDTVICNHIVQMYRKCGDMEQARAVFDSIPQKNVVSWNIIIAAYALKGDDEEAIRLFEKMVGDEQQQANMFTLGSIVGIYGRCGKVEEAHNAFEKMLRKDVAAYNALISAYAQSGQHTEAIQLYSRMKLEGIKPNVITFSAVIASTTTLKQGKAIHEQFLRSGYRSDWVLDSALLKMYAACGSLVDAYSVFDGIARKEVVAWTCMITAYAQHGRLQEAVELYDQMQSVGVQADKVAYICILGAVASLEALEKGKAIHASITESDTALDIAIVHMYAKCHSLHDARMVFDKMTCKNQVAWTSMIRAYDEEGDDSEAVEMFRRMDLEGVTPDAITFLIMLGVCGKVADLKMGKTIHTRLVSAGLEADAAAIENGILNMYAKCKSFGEMIRVFEQMKWRDVSSWNTLISAYAEQAHLQEAVVAYRRMDLEGTQPSAFTLCIMLSVYSEMGDKAESVAVHQRLITTGLQHSNLVMTGNALVSMYARFSDLNNARSVFEKMSERSLVTWNSMIGAYAQQAQTMEALELFRRMDVEPNAITYTTILTACVEPQHLDIGRSIHAKVIESHETSLAIETALVTMYGKCGRLDIAKQVFDGMQRRDVVAWNAMIAASLQNEDDEHVVSVYKHMALEGVRPVGITYMGIINACAQLRAIALGRQIHKQIQVDIDGWECAERSMIVMYCNCGSIEEGRLVFERIGGMNRVCWNTMLAAYAHYGHAIQAFELYCRMMLEGVDANSITLTSLLHACSHAGLQNKARNYFIEMCIDHGLEPIVEHYHCMIDMLGRAGCLDKAEDLIKSMPCQPGAVGWNALLGACTGAFLDFYKD